MILPLLSIEKKSYNFLKKILIGRLSGTNSIVLNVGLDFLMLDKKSGVFEKYG
jgi:hypothetical protein